MYDDIRARIEEGGYDLGRIITQIERIWLDGEIDVAQRDELRELARGRASPSDSLGTVEERLTVLEKAVADILGRLEAAADDDVAGHKADGYPEWVQPVGTLNVYMAGDRVTHNGKTYESKIDNNVWSPSDYPQGWMEVH